MADELQGAQGADIGKHQRAEGDQGELPVEKLEKQQQGHHGRDDQQHGGEGGKQDLPQALGEKVGVKQGVVNAIGCTELGGFVCRSWSDGDELDQLAIRPGRDAQQPLKARGKHRR